MPVFYSPVPENLQMGLAYMGGSVFTNNRTADSDFTREQEDTSAVNELVSHLPLQMLLYFNMFYFPCWWFSAVFMLEVKFCYLPGYYQALLITGMILLTVIEVIRLYLGYIGNLKEKHLMPDCSIFASPPSTNPSSPSLPSCHQMPELAAFWLLSFMFQLPVLLFFLTDEGIIILPFERAVHSLYLLFLLAQILASFLALRTMTRKLTLLFHLRQFGKVESFRHAGMSPVYGLPYHRSVLPMSPTRDMYH
ncbi:transmembrane protein 17A isoform X1 [Siniperca chuatsi]|uniref:transmembrane protein 17A isoform X1 n=1 Tax=Siniperca chuatsi TaxID=119488 RepID=UPI001CE0A7F1|nr:transmembrane protein 17A isoform X1 [Siniperca chuatsi]